MLSPFRRPVTWRMAEKHASQPGGLSFVGSTFTESPVLSNPAKLTSQRAVSVVHPMSALDTSYSWGCRTVCGYSSRGRGKPPAFGCRVLLPMAEARGPRTRSI